MYKKYLQYLFRIVPIHIGHTVVTILQDSRQTLISIFGKWNIAQNTWTKKNIYFFEATQQKYREGRKSKTIIKGGETCKIVSFSFTYCQSKQYQTLT